MSVAKIFEDLVPLTLTGQTLLVLLVAVGPIGKSDVGVIDRALALRLYRDNARRLAVQGLGVPLSDMDVVVLITGVAPPPP